MGLFPVRKSSSPCNDQFPVIDPLSEATPIRCAVKLDVSARTISPLAEKGLMEKVKYSSPSANSISGVCRKSQPTKNVV